MPLSTLHSNNRNSGFSSSLIVIGGGAAGFFCAINVARLNPLLQVTIIEKSSKLLSKVKVSGGGRCNVTHACFDIPALIKKYPRGQNFLKKAFHWFATKDTIDWFEERGVALKTEADGRMFPITNNSQTIVDCLLKEADKYGVQILLNTEVKKIEKTEERFQLSKSDGGLLSANFLCIACGGFPKSAQFDWVKQLGHTIEEPIPSLFTFKLPIKQKEGLFAAQAGLPKNNITALMGISVEQVRVKITGSKLAEEGPLLITHWGFSGPAILKLSAFGARELEACNYHFSISINWLPQYNEYTLKEEWLLLRNKLAVQKISNRNPFNLPARLWLYLLEQTEVNIENNWAALTAKQQNKLIQTLTGQVFEVKGKTTFKEEFVTCGGIKLSEIEVNTMQSKIVSGLFFAGEIINVDGITGGFNFQNAWTTGWIAAKHISTAANVIPPL